MAHYQLIIAYDGTEFRGFQRQGTARTVQVEVEKALRTLGWKGKSILSAGRTDTGVHASGQVVAFDLDWWHQEEVLLAALNAKLPLDIAAQSIKEVEKKFHPRFDAISRSYRYRVLFSPIRDPLQERFAWRVWPAADLDKMKAAAYCLEGTHDFCAFGRAMKPGETTLRHVFSARWQKTAEKAIVFEVEANAFLYHMVRRMVYLQVQVGQGRIGLEQFCQSVEKALPLKPGLAKPQGLTLVCVKYNANKN